MEYYADHNFLEELLALRTQPWEEVSVETNEFYNNGWALDCFAKNPSPIPPPNSSLEGYALPKSAIDQTQSLNYCSLFAECYYTPFGEVSPPELTDSSFNKLETPPFPSQEDLSSIMDDESQGLLIRNCVPNLDVQGATTRRSEIVLQEPFKSAEEPVFNMGICPEVENKTKKLNSQPSKNLMAERRRRKRLNDRLSMLRSVVPKISKMDRTAILGDTIDYMKELLERINSLQEEKFVGSNQPSLMSIFKDVKPNEVSVRNSPKFNVERTNSGTRIEICCAGKPGLLLSTLTTLDALGLDVQQCVISCFNDFTVHASCSEEMEKRGILSSEDIKQALFRNAGYGGRCF